ncbi:holin [Planococcaceae bacterium Storch 2/2-2]|nr:holin [Planococcaceae bacterium Storch 2/2-2]
MEEILMFSTVLAPIVVGMTELIKRTTVVPERYLSVVALFCGLVIGVLAVPFTELDVYIRLWSGALAGLASVGLFELSTTPRKEEER